MTDDAGLREACGIFGCVAVGNWPTELDVAHTICMGLVGLQHRGQESAGIVTSAGMSLFNIKKGMGLVGSIFQDDDLAKLQGNLGIGHTRYSTIGCSEMINIQPFVVETLHGLIAVAHNGELVNAKHLKDKLLRHGVGLSTGTDSELITQLLTHMPDCGEPYGANWIARIKKAMQQTLLSYALLMMHGDKMYAVRDPFGNRPLCIGKIVNSSENTSDEEEIIGWIASSESCAFSGIGAKYYREVLPGEIVELSREGIKSHCIIPRPEAKLPALCIFEYVYFSRSDSILEGQLVYQVRKRCGRQLAKEAPADVDLISTVPESATPAALEYARELGIPYGEVLCKNRYVGRTFIQPSIRLRKLGVAKKFGLLAENFHDKRIVLIDDSIVRGNTMKPIVQLLKNGGAKEVHIRVASPPIRYPCFMGINIPTKEELIANLFPLEELASHLGADSLQYLSIEGLVKATQEGIKNTRMKGEEKDKVEKNEIGHCVACLTGEYPVKLDW
ncbi:hypothetical protein CHS0354_041916 [Potamilus streckersoni]|uniref:Amidophosphoribosyltransferase n=1 Tax=Potamilus streckersoni TaxID=2493646 RepID=A0AAE0W0H5_9BIVA|nr:hypothetical protein CHS0354_041916 [Potamilus streckersoni]